MKIVACSKCVTFLNTAVVLANRARNILVIMFAYIWTKFVRLLCFLVLVFVHVVCRKDEPGQNISVLPIRESQLYINQHCAELELCQPLYTFPAEIMLN